MAEMGGSALAQLAFWSRNMTKLRDERMSWPGFSYTDVEWARMQTLAETVSPAAFRNFLNWNAVVFIAVAALGIVGVFMPLATLLFPVPAETVAWKFATLLAACALLILALGLAFSMRVAARWSADAEMRTRLQPAAGDDALAAKVSWQIDRMVLIMCGALVPGILVFIAYDIQAGPIITALKWTANLLVIGSLATVAVRNRR
jgi:hypothetical protein